MWGVLVVYFSVNLVRLPTIYSISCWMHIFLSKSLRMSSSFWMCNLCHVIKSSKCVYWPTHWCTCTWNPNLIDLLSDNDTDSMKKMFFFNLFASSTIVYTTGPNRCTSRVSCCQGSYCCSACYINYYIRWCCFHSWSFMDSSKWS